MRRPLLKRRRLNAPGGVIAVVDDGGNLMALERLDGTFAAGANISIGKARTAVLFQTPTRVFRRHHQEWPHGNGCIAGRLLHAAAGRRPDRVDGQIVGGVGVSGAASAQQDEELAMAGAKRFANKIRSMAVNAGLVL